MATESDWVGRLRTFLAVRREGDAELLDLVLGARADGVTWQAIAEALDTTNPVVHRRFAAEARRRGIGRLYDASMSQPLPRVG